MVSAPKLEQALLAGVFVGTLASRQRIAVLMLELEPLTFGFELQRRRHVLRASGHHGPCFDDLLHASSHFLSPAPRAVSPLLRLAF